MGLVFALELLAIALLFVLLNVHLGRKRMHEKVHMGSKDKESLMRAAHAHGMCTGYCSLGVAFILYLWIQGIHPVFAIIYGGVLLGGSLIYAYSVLCHEPTHKKDKHLYAGRVLGGVLALAAILAAAITAFVALL